MFANLVVVFNFIISQWSLSPQAFKDAVLYAALAKCVLAVLWWTMRMLVAKFPARARFRSFRRCSTTGWRSSWCSCST